MVYRIEAHFTAFSEWEIEFDLNSVHHWYIKYDVLYAKHSKDEDYKEYSPSYTGDCDYKSPDKVFQAVEDNLGWTGTYQEVE